MLRFPENPPSDVLSGKNFPFPESYYDRTEAEETEKQLEARKHNIWRIKPVGPLEFTEKYIGTKSMSKAQIDTMLAIFGDDPTNKFFNVEQAILRIGQGGGKNFIITRCVVYLIYLWCCLEDPHAYFGLAHDEPFDILNYSQVNAQQARNVFFKSLSNILRMTKDPEDGQNWFVKHMGLRIKQYGAGDIKDSEMVIPNRNPLYGDIRVYALDTSAKSVEGYTIWVTIMDEPSRANTKIKYGTAKHQYNTAYTNQKSRFSNPFHRLTLLFSYPEQEVNDLLVELFELYSKNPVENQMEIIDDVLTAWYATYVFNAKDQALKKVLYKKAHKNDPIDADKRWRAIVPPNVFGFFMPHFTKIGDCANPNLISPVTAVETTTVRAETVKGVLTDVNYSALELTNVKGDTRDRWWGADFATNKDMLVLAGGYADTSDREVDEFTWAVRNEEGKEKFEKKAIDCRPVIDVILIWRIRKPGEVIDYQNVEDVIMSLFNNYFPNSRALHFDQWNTESIRQKVLDAGVGNCEKLSFSNPMQLHYGKLVRHLVWNNAMEYLPEPILQREMTQLILENNTKLDHPTSGCFVGDTRIPLANGTYPTIAELDGKKVTVFSSTPDGKIVSGKARGRLTKYVDRLVDVMLDTGAVVRCTPEHRWMLKNGQYKEAQYLRLFKDVLMPLNQAWIVNKSEQEISVEIGVRAVLPIHLDKPVPVYDLEVDEWNNFALAAGVVVHNSKDIWDAVSIATNLIMEYGGKGSRLSIETGEDSDIDAELDEMLAIYDKAFRNFIETKKRKPVDTSEMREWLRQTKGVDWSIAEVSMIHESWKPWSNTLNAKMSLLGVKTSGKVSPMGQSTDSESLSQEIAEQTDSMSTDPALKVDGNLIF